MQKEKPFVPPIELDFDQARTRHLLFKTNLRSILYGSDTERSSILSEYECSVGKWIYSHGLEQYGHITEMHTLEKVHADIHTCARALVTQYNAGQVEEAREGLLEMEAIADNLIELLGTVEARIKEQILDGGDLPETNTNLHTNYSELQNLQQTIQQLDIRIKEQTRLSHAARRLAEANENKFRNTVMQAPVGIVILRSEDMVVEMANETYLQIVDRQKEDFVGKPIFETLPALDKVIRPLLSSIMETGAPHFGNETEVYLQRYGKLEQTFFNFVYSPLREDEKITGIMMVATEVTLQVKANLALSAKDAQFRRLVSQSPVAMVIFRGSDFIVEIANNTLLKNIWQKSLEQVEGKKLMDIFPELEGQSFPRLLRKVFEKGETLRAFEEPVIVPSADSARNLFLDYEYSAILEADGSTSGVMVTVNDVTEKVTARKIIEAVQKKYSELLEILPVAVYTIDAAGKLDLFNQAAADLWQTFPEKGLHQWDGAYKLFSLDNKEIQPENYPIRRAMEENRSFTMEMYVQRPGGEMRHVIAYPQPLIQDEGKEVRGAMNVLIDITVGKLAEKALTMSEEKFRVLANSMPQFIWTANNAGELNYFSQSVFDYTGYDETRIFEEGWLTIVHPDDREANISFWTEAISQGTNFIFEHRFRRDDGEYRWQLSRAVPQRDKQGSIQMWVGTSTDIHDRRVFLDELKEKVDERTRELTDSNERLLKTNAELAQFAYVASHDLQEPLRKIQTFVSRINELEKDTLSKKSQDYFARIQTSSLRTQQLIQDLLSYSRTNTTEKNFLPVNLNLLVKTLREGMYATTAENRVTIHTRELPTVPAIEFQMEQLFTNLLTNAIKFSREGIPAVIEISADKVKGGAIGEEEAPKNKIFHHITVKDNGIGFDPQFRERIFLVFQRLHAKEAYPGTGIGLAICKKIMESHNGFIRAEGFPGEGAEFHIYLPIL
ncbi:MAG: PAS domain-containing protein [Ferruginibacter sp.]